MTDDAGDEAFRSRVREALDRLVHPNAPAWEAQRRIPREGWLALGDAGLLSLAVRGDGFARSAVFLEELGALGFAGIRTAIGVHAFMATSYVDFFGSESQRCRYLEPARQGRRIAALAITEEQAGSDLRWLATVAERQDDGSYRLTGEKCHIVNGSSADFFVVLARARSEAVGRSLAGVILMIVDAQQDGVSAQPEALLGWHGADVCRVHFRGARVPADALLGPPNRGLVQLMRTLDFERLVAGLLAVGGVRYCLDLVGRFVHHHVVGDTQLSARQAVRHRVAALAADLDLVRQYARHATRLHCRGQLDAGTAAVVKAKATALAVEAAQMCVQYHGARGLLEDAAPARLYRDAMAGTIAAGANELLLDVIFEMLSANAAESGEARTSHPGVDRRDWSRPGPSS